MKPTPVRSKNVAKRAVSKVGKPARRALPARTAVPSFSISKLINGFASFRTTLQNLSQSLQRLESMMEHTTKLFSVGRNMRFGRQPFLPQLPKPPVNQQEFDGEEIPTINLPKMPASNSPLVRLFDHLDMTQVMKFLQSPTLQNILTQIFPTKQATTRAVRQPRPRKPNVRKRVRP